MDKTFDLSRHNVYLDTKT